SSIYALTNAMRSSMLPQGVLRLLFDMENTSPVHIPLPPLPWNNSQLLLKDLTSTYNLTHITSSVTKVGIGSGGSTSISSFADLMYFDGSRWDHSTSELVRADHELVRHWTLEYWKLTHIIEYQFH